MSYNQRIDWKDRIVNDPKILSDKPFVKGTRLSVEFILELLSQGWSKDEILRNYPDVSRDGILVAGNTVTRKPFALT